MDNTNNYDVREGFARVMRSKEAEILRNILANLTGREPTIDDTKSLTKLYREGEPLDYTLLYQNKPIGIVSFKQDGLTWTITFSPGITPVPLFPPGGIPFKVVQSPD